MIPGDDLANIFIFSSLFNHEVIYYTQGCQIGIIINISSSSIIIRIIGGVKSNNIGTAEISFVSAGLLELVDGIAWRDALWCMTFKSLF